MKKRITAVASVLNELLWCGGEQKTRQQIYEELLADGFEPRYVDYYLFCLSQHQPTTEKKQREKDLLS